MKQVISTVVSEVDLRPADPRSERAAKSAIAFVPHRHALVVSTQHHATGQSRTALSPPMPVT